MRTRMAILLLSASYVLGCTSSQDLTLQLSQAVKPGTRTDHFLVNKHNLKAQRIRCNVPVELGDDPVYATDDPDLYEVSKGLLTKIDRGCAQRYLDRPK